MRVPTFKPSTDLEQLRQQLITFQDQLNRALAGLGFEYAQRLTFTFRPEELPKLIQHNMPKPAAGLIPAYLRNLTSASTVPTDGIFVDWIPESGAIKIRGISGLTAANLYEIRLMAYA